MPNYNLSGSKNYIYYTDTTGSTIFDTGGPSGNYADNENIYFGIYPAYATGTLTINITEFNSESTYDYLRIYDRIPPTSSFTYQGTTESGNLIKVLTGTPTVPITVTSSTGFAYLRWSSDGSQNRAGFKLSWTGSGTYTVDSSSNVPLNKYAVTFPKDATSGSYMTFEKGMLSSSATLAANKDIVTSFWAKYDPAGAPTDAATRNILGIGNNGGHELRVAKVGGSNDLRLYYTDVSGTISLTAATAILMGGGSSGTQYPPQWHHYGIALRKTSVTGAVALFYRDGQRFSSVTVTKGTNWGYLTSSVDTVLGSARDSGTTISTTSTWTGSLDDVFLATVDSGSIVPTYDTLFSNIYNSGRWSNPISAVSSSFSASLNPAVVFNWRFEETGSMLNTKDYGSYGNYHSASSVSNIFASNVSLTTTESGISYTPYSSLEYSASVRSGAVISFSTSSSSVYENTSSYIFNVQVLTASVGQSATASIATGSSNQTAVLGTNYNLIFDGTTYSSSVQLPIYVSWSAGETTTKYITSSIFDNTTYTGTSSSFSLFIQTASSTNITASSPFSFTLNILDYEEGYPTFTSSSYSFGEISEGTASIYVDRISGSNGPLSISYSTTNNTALSGTNYVKTTGTLSWVDGNSTRQLISVPFINDNLYTSDLSFRINLSNLSTGSYSNYPLAITSSTVTIVDQEPGTFNWEVTSLSAYETASNATVNILRTSGSYGNVTASVFYSSSAGTVSPRTGSAGTATFSGSQTTTQFVLPLTDDLIDEQDDPIYITFSSFTSSVGTAKTGSQGTLIFTLIDNETGSVTFSSASAAIYENTASYYVGVERLYGGDQAETASITFVGSTYAVSGSDYNIIYNGVTQSSPFNVTWADQDKTTKYITASIINDNVLESDETITFGIASSSISAIGPSSSFVLTVYDYEITGSARFVTSSYSVSIPSSVTVQVERYNGADVSASAIIDVSSSSTAVAGVDYANIFPYTVNWSNQESGSKNITVSTLSSWGPSSVLNLKFTSLTNLASGSILTSSVAITSTTITQSSSPNQNVSRDYVINDYANLSYQFTRRAQQVPFALNKKGTGLIRKL